MINTTIYRRAQFKKMTLLIIALLSLYAFFFRPVQALIENGLPNGNEKTVSLRSLDDTQEILTGKATSISADELYMIFTQSNELIEIVDARSEDEYQTSHIESARSLETFQKRAEGRFPPIRVFFYSNNNNRSKEIANYYAEQGFKAYFVIGGLNAWRNIKGLTYLTNE